MERSTHSEHESTITPFNPEALNKFGNFIDQYDGLLTYDQLENLSYILEFLQQNGADARGYIEAPTGYGKGLLCAELCRGLDVPAIVVTSRRKLVQQLSQAFDDVGVPSSKVGRVFTHEATFGRQWTITTYDSVFNYGLTPLFMNHQPRLVVWDEAHNLLGPATQELPDYFPGVAHIGLTATADYSETRQLTEVLQNEIKVVNQAEAIEKGRIAPYASFILKTGLDFSSLKTTAQGRYYENKTLEKLVNSEERDEIVAQCCQDLYVEDPRHKFLVYCSSVEHAERMSELLRAKGISAAAISYHNTDDEQRAMYRGFRYGRLAALTNDKLLTEGFDDRGATVCVNAAPTRSPLRARQRAGRVERTDPENPSKTALIIDVVDEDYRDPPVLYADPRAAGAATMGGAIIPDSLLNNPRIISDPEEINLIAGVFYENRVVHKGPIVPEGWYLWANVKPLFDKIGGWAILKSHLNQYPQWLAENRQKVGEQRYVYSPAFMVWLEEQVAERTAKATPPPYWATATQVSEIYGAGLGRRFAAFVQSSGHADEWSDEFGMKDKHAYYSQAAQLAFAESIGRGYTDLATTIPQGWQTEADFQEEHGVLVYEYAIKTLEQRYEKKIVHHRLVAAGQPCLSPWLQKTLLRLGEVPRTWGEPINPTIYGIGYDDFHELVSTITTWEPENLRINKTMLGYEYSFPAKIHQQIVAALERQA